MRLLLFFAALCCVALITCSRNDDVTMAGLQYGRTSGDAVNIHDAALAPVWKDTLMANNN
ncbi:hypothetical protein [Chitinophaga japonensis]|uniref:Uncharacterized protein n=1 Tax=Chitinophaga japonensis TaxID=104662 RepID=A0A562TCL7_CHIJA|nr:hypothetical protein [Chitinophaga japonensis]TWI90994.1 hypothetical protein LX66_0355 [Chitinophaga japonensis]